MNKIVTLFAILSPAFLIFISPSIAVKHGSKVKTEEDQETNRNTVTRQAMMTQENEKQKDQRKDSSSADFTASKTLKLLDLKNLGIDRANVLSVSMKIRDKAKGFFGIDLSHNKIEEGGVWTLSKSLAYHPQITFLNFSHNDINDEAVGYLISLSHLKGLDLSYNKIGNPGAYALTQMTNLTFLNLEYNTLGFEGLKAIAFKFGSSQIKKRTISLKGNLLQLEDFKNSLKDLDISNLVLDQDSHNSTKQKDGNLQTPKPFFTSTPQKVQEQEFAERELFTQNDVPLPADLPPLEPIALEEINERSHEENALSTQEILELKKANQETQNLTLLSNESTGSSTTHQERILQQGKLDFRTAMALATEDHKRIREVNVKENTNVGTLLFENIEKTPATKKSFVTNILNAPFEEPKDIIQPQESSPTETSYAQQLENLKKELGAGNKNAVPALIRLYQQAGKTLKNYASEEEIQSLHDLAGKILFSNIQQELSPALKLLQHQKSFPSREEFHAALNAVLD